MKIIKFVYTFRLRQKCFNEMLIFLNAFTKQIKYILAVNTYFYLLIDMSINMFSLILIHM